MRRLLGGHHVFTSAIWRLSLRRSDLVIKEIWFRTNNSQDFINIYKCHNKQRVKSMQKSRYLRPFASMCRCTDKSPMDIIRIRLHALPLLCCLEYNLLYPIPPKALLTTWRMDKQQYQVFIPLPLYVAVILRSPFLKRCLKSRGIKSSFIPFPHFMLGVALTHHTLLKITRNGHATVSSFIPLPVSIVGSILFPYHLHLRYWKTWRMDNWTLNSIKIFPPLQSPSPKSYWKTTVSRFSR